MKAMILAAGRGERMRPLTDETPKALLKAGGQRLIEHHLHALAAAGFEAVIINVSHLADQIETALGFGGDYGIPIQYSDERDGALETAGGIATALPMLGDAPFLVMNCDVYCDYPLARVIAFEPKGMAHLVLVDNPPHHVKGDFALIGDRVAEVGGSLLTFSGIGVYRPGFFAEVASGKPCALAPLLRVAMKHGLVTGEHYTGAWHDVGTRQRLVALDRRLTASNT